MVLSNRLMNIKNEVHSQICNMYREISPFIIKLFKKVKDNKNDTLLISIFDLNYLSLTYANERYKEALVIKDSNYEFALVMNDIRDSKEEKRIWISIFCCSEIYQDYPTLKDFTLNYEKNRHNPHYKIDFGYFKQSDESHEFIGNGLNDIYHFCILEKLLFNLESIKIELENE